ncbi:ATP-dependent Clp protease ATP-binding subunit ClpC [Clostridia bacterium]|nr:ATP-dependent Clp protease ATP-binding subunit ClpC [Clostridia bacterium]
MSYFQFAMTDNLKRVLDIARETAATLNSPEIGTEHLLFGILSAGGSLASKLLNDAGVKADDLDEVLGNQTAFVGFNGSIDFSPRVKRILFNAKELAAQGGLNYCAAEHVLLAMCESGDGVAYQYLAGRTDVEKLTDKLEESLENDAPNRPAAANSAPSGMDFRQFGQKPQRQGQTGKSALPPILKDTGIDLTQKARDHKIDPIIGRREEIERIVQILCRKTKNNPVLIGEPGVGKSAVVEGLAQAIVDQNVPELLKDKIIFTLDIGSLMAGTKYRGSLEEKLKDIIETISRAGNIIVFIDELHTLASAGHEKGEVSPADMLKPYLARGELQTIGATTTDEYRKFIEKDKALERRFQPIIVNPPSVEETIEIIKGIRDNYEAFHKVKITDEAIEAAVKLSDRYIMDRYLPDKAIDLVDEAASRLKVNSNTAPPDIKGKETELQKLENEKAEALRLQDYEKAGKIRDKINALTAEIGTVKKKWEEDRKTMKAAIDPEDIAAIVSKWTSIPVTRINETEKERLLKLEDILRRRVIGQDEAIGNVARAMRRARAGLKDPKRPIGSFIFLGPTGVGKTELTKALAEAMFDDENLIIRLDMSEYMEAHSVSKMIGSPPGYVGFDEGGQLTEQVRRKPYSVVLFDEIEKAHPDVFNMLLQILDEGRLTDAQGRVVNFKNSIVIMTSNVGVSELKTTIKNLGFRSDDGEKKNEGVKDVLTEALKRRFKPEFLNRVDVITIFNPLAKADIEKIARLMLKKVEEKLKDKEIAVRFTEAAVSRVAETGYDAEYGARPLRRVIEQKIEDPLAEKLLAGAFTGGDTLVCDTDGKGEFVFRKE